MLGHKWEPAQGTIVEAHSGTPAGHGGAALHHERRYVIEVRTPTGELIRGNVTDKGGLPHPVGAVIAVEVHSKSGEIRIDPSARTDSVRGMIQVTEQMRASAAPAVHVIGPDGQELPIHANPGEISNLARAVMSGDPAAQQAAADRLHQLRDQARQRAAAHQQQHGAGPAPVAEGFSGSPGPSTFDEIGTRGHIQAPGTGAFGEPASSFSFDLPSAPTPYPQVSPPMPTAPAAFGSFNTGPGEGTVEQRIARLQQLLDKGILTESEFEAQRQQVISGI